MKVRGRDRAALDALKASDTGSYQVLAAVANSLPLGSTGLDEHEALVTLCELIGQKLVEVSMRIKNTHVDVRWRLPRGKSWRYVRIDFEAGGPS